MALGYKSQSRFVYSLMQPCLIHGCIMKLIVPDLNISHIELIYGAIYRSFLT